MSPLALCCLIGCYLCATVPLRQPRYPLWPLLLSAAATIAAIVVAAYRGEMHKS